MYSIPTSVDIDGKKFTIRNNGDYRVILDCFSALNDAELSKQERLLASLIIFYEDLNSTEDIGMLGDVEQAVKEMYKFFNCGSTNDYGKTSVHKVIDWELDEQMICSAINKVANQEIRVQPYIHWWTFMGYYTAIGNCPLSYVVEIRDKIIKGKKLDKDEREFRNNNPQLFAWKSKTVEETEADKLVRELWNNGG